MIQKTGNRPGVVSKVQPGGGMVTKAAIAPMVVTNNAPQRSGSSRGKVEGTGVQFQEYELVNATGAAVNYMIGDALGQAAQNSGLTVVNPTSTTSGTVAGQKSLYATRPIQVGSMNLQATVSSAQFRQPVRYVTSAQDGSARIVPLRIAPFRSSSDYDTLVRTVDVSNAPVPVVLNDQAGIVFTVNAGETLYVALEVLQRVAN